MDDTPTPRPDGDVLKGQTNPQVTEPAPASEPPRPDGETRPDEQDRDEEWAPPTWQELAETFVAQRDKARAEVASLTEDLAAARRVVEACVVRPGDRLILRYTRPLTMREVTAIITQVEGRLPGVAVVVVQADGMAVYRPLAAELTAERFTPTGHTAGLSTGNPQG